MRYDEFIVRVRALSHARKGEAERATRAVLTTLAERIGRKEAADTAAQLPKELKDALQLAGDVAQVFDAREFVRRVAERADLPPDRAKEITRAVFATLHEAVAHGELADWELELSTDYVDLVARHADVGGHPRGAEPGTPGHAEVMIETREFYRRAAERAGLDEDPARLAVRAVLETLGERIAAGEAKDLAAELPEEIARPLLLPGGPAQAMPADEFVERVAKREHTLPAVAREHTRAVLTTLREVVTADEWHDAVAELPRDYDDLLSGFGVAEPAR